MDKEITILGESCAGLYIRHLQEKFKRDNWRLHSLIYINPLLNYELMLKSYPLFLYKENFLSLEESQHLSKNLSEVKRDEDFFNKTNTLINEFNIKHRVNVYNIN